MRWPSYFAQRTALQASEDNGSYRALLNSKIENHGAAVALYYFAYNFIKMASTVVQAANAAHLCVLKKMGQSESGTGAVFRITIIFVAYIPACA